MEKLNDLKSVDANQELIHMIDYVLNTWDGDKETLSKIVSDAFNEGYKTAEYWIKKHCSDSTTEWFKERDNLLKKDYDDFIYNDDIRQISYNFLMNSSSFQEIQYKNWNFEKITNKLTNKIKSEITDLNLFPKGWKKVLDSKESAFEYFEYFNLESDNLFKGYDSSTAGAAGFNQRINLANTFYNEKDQSRNRLNTLVSSAFAHGLTIKEHNNQCELDAEINRIKELYSEEQYNKPTYIADLTLLSNNKLFKALMIDKYNLENKNTHTSQEDLDSYIKEKNENKFIYGLIEFNIKDNEVNNSYAQKIYSFNHFQEQINNNINLLLEKSDNNNLIVDLHAIKSSLNLKQLSQKEFNNLSQESKTLKEPDYSFFKYSFPNKDELLAMRNKIADDIISEILSEDDDKKEIRENRDTLYEQKILSVLESLPKTKTKPR